MEIFNLLISPFIILNSPYNILSHFYILWQTNTKHNTIELLYDTSIWKQNCPNFWLFLLFLNCTLNHHHLIKLVTFIYCSFIFSSLVFYGFGFTFLHFSWFYFMLLLFCLYLLTVYSAQTYLKVFTTLECRRPTHHTSTIMEYIYILFL